MLTECVGTARQSALSGQWPSLRAGNRVLEPADGAQRGFLPTTCVTLVRPLKPRGGRSPRQEVGAGARLAPGSQELLGDCGLGARHRTPLKPATPTPCSRGSPSGGCTLLGRGVTPPSILRGAPTAVGRCRLTDPGRGGGTFELWCWVTRGHRSPPGASVSWSANWGCLHLS